MAPFRSLGMLVGQAQRAVAGGTRIFEVLDSGPGSRSAPARGRMPPGAGDIRLEGVSFASRGRGRRRSTASTSTSPAGRTIALIGPTGSGKTTLTQLIPRFYEATGQRC